MWTFIQEQIFSMKWLRDFIGNLLSALGFDITKKIGGSIQFFLYDVIKIVILLCILIFVISYIQSFFPPERTKKKLGRFHGIIANIIAALLGTVTPFCSCSSIPLFIGFTSAGFDSKIAWKWKSVWCNYRNNRGCAYVRRYLWMYSDCGSFACKRCKAWSSTFFHDGCYYT